MTETLKPIPDAWKEVATELRTFHRILPQLIADGHTGRYVVIRGDRVYDTWDSSRDASQYGYGIFDDGKFISQPIDPRMLDALRPYFGVPDPVVVSEEAA